MRAAPPDACAAFDFFITAQHPSGVDGAQVHGAESDFWRYSVILGEIIDGRLCEPDRPPSRLTPILERYDPASDLLFQRRIDRWRRKRTRTFFVGYEPMGVEVYGAAECSVSVGCVLFDAGQLPRSPKVRVIL